MDEQKKKKRASKNRQTLVSDVRPELLFTVVNRSKAEYYVDLLQAFEINAQLVMLGHGTADANTLAFFGLTDSEKAVIIGVVRSDRLQDVLSTLDKKFKTIKNGKGIAYTVPVSSVIGTLIYGFLTNNKKTVKEENK